VQVQPGDCGPNGIVLVHNFTRWMDAASQHYFGRARGAAGVSDDRSERAALQPDAGVHMRFKAYATDPDVLRFQTRIDEWRANLFFQSHRVMRGDTLIGEGRETREFCCLDTQGRLRPLPVPPWIRSRCH
jgi:4-hydroxybenzoyl-CoA thioesterase